MTKIKPLTNDEMCILRDILDTILEDGDLRRGIKNVVGTTSGQLKSISIKLSDLVLTSLNGGIPPANGRV
jgi:hypothetical protein